MYLDAHTHVLSKSSEIKSIISLDPRNEQFSDLDHHFFTLGLHPWYIAEVSLDKVFAKIASLRSHPNFLGLGECGLDRHRSDDFELQIKIFKQQLDYAQKNGINLVVIHCVRAFADLLEVLKESKYRGQLFFHDYNGNVETTQSLMAYASYFSFGYKLKNATTKAFKSFQFLPMDRIFLETDDYGITIEEVYHLASEIKKITLSDLKIQMEKNLNIMQNKIS